MYSREGDLRLLFVTWTERQVGIRDAEERLKVAFSGQHCLYKVCEF